MNATAQQTPPTANPQERKDAADDFRNLYSNASEAYKRGDYATAVNLLRRATSINPDNGNAWNELGRALLAINQVDAATEALQKSIKLDPSSRNAYNNLGLVYWRERKYDDAAIQFRKQIVVNPDDPYAHRNLGMMLRDALKCSDAIPELQKGLSLTPPITKSSLLAEGECDLDLGNLLNTAAYALAKRDIDIEMAEKWSDACLTIDIGAGSYVGCLLQLGDALGTGDHLGQIYERLGRKQDAARVYAMGIATADQLTRARVDLDDLADAKKRLATLAEDSDGRVAQGRSDLRQRGVISIANQGSASGSADFAVLLSAKGKPAEFRQINGDKSFAKLADSLRAAKLPISLPEVPGVEVPLRGTLTCHSEEARCSFAFLTPEEAVNAARNETELASATPATSAKHDPHVYDNPAMGMRISLPDDWKLIREEPGSFSRPRNAMFGKSGSLATFMLTREHFEGSLDLYLKMLDNFFSKKTEFKRAGEEAVKRDELTGTRWIVSWNENGIPYSAGMEMFGVGDDYYRITTLAPKEVYDRYAETFENVLHSVQFPMLRADPRLLDPTK